jgi:spore coat polysaccharide biosynthesis protein SpsF
MKSKVNYLAIIQARMTSSRLPGKVLKTVVDAPMIIKQIERIRTSTKIEQLVVATSSEASDDILVNTLSRYGIECFRGNLNDVLGRFSDCHLKYPARNIIRLTADCPLADGEVIDKVISSHEHSGVDYTSNTLIRTFPRGLDVECFSEEAFNKLLQLDLGAAEHEHVTMGFYNHPELFTLGNVQDDTDRSKLRWTVDYPEDLEFVQQIYAKLYPSNANFSSADILKVISENPELNRLESDIKSHG